MHTPPNSIYSDILLADEWKYSKMPPKATAQTGEDRLYRMASWYGNTRRNANQNIVALVHVTSLRNRILRSLSKT